MYSMHASRRPAVKEALAALPRLPVAGNCSCGTVTFSSSSVSVLQSAGLKFLPIRYYDTEMNYWPAILAHTFQL